jgi:hypothetical protein
MSRIEGSGRVGGTQFDDQAVNGLLSTDKPAMPSTQDISHCNSCNRDFLTSRINEHVETIHG